MVKSRKDVFAKGHQDESTGGKGEDRALKSQVNVWVKFQKKERKNVKRVNLRGLGS